MRLEDYNSFWNGSFSETCVNFQACKVFFVRCRRTEEITEGVGGRQLDLHFRGYVICDVDNKSG